MLAKSGAHTGTMFESQLHGVESHLAGVLDMRCRTSVALLPDSEPNFILYFPTEIA